MFNFRVAPLPEACALIRSGWATHGISILDPGTEMTVLAPLGHLVLTAHDSSGSKGSVRQGPTRGDVERLLAFAATIPAEANLIVNCHAGLGRSPAAAIAALVSAGMAPSQAVADVGAMRPWMLPNRAILAHADDLLGLSGALSRAVDAWIEARDADTPAGLIITG